jgi:ParD-like antitoxin of type II bacterial toxin-antitoxin system
MGQPVKLSDELILDARVAAAAMQRSIAGQVEFWARIGESLERVAHRSQIERLQEKAALPLSKIVATINRPAGRARLKAYLDSRPFPRFSPHPKLARTFVREDADGSRTVGRFMRGEFIAARSSKGRSASTVKARA